MNLGIFTNQLQTVAFGGSELDQKPLETILDAIPRLDSIVDVPEGSAVLIRADLDTSIRDGKVGDTARIEACLPTIEYCCKKGWKPVIFGHIGRDWKNSAEPVRDAMSQRLGQDIKFVEDWLNREEDGLDDDFVARVVKAEPGAAFMLQNTRKYKIETAMWKMKSNELAATAQQMYKIAEDIRNRLTAIEINEAIAASNTDFSSSAVPLLMDRTAFGFYIAEEMKYVKDVRKANCVVFSGLKIDKLDDLEGIVDRGMLKVVIAGGSLAMALKKAYAQLQAGDFFIGLAETDSSQKAYITRERIEQAKSILIKCQKSGTEVVLPIDFVLDNGEISEEIPKNHAQMDIGPQTQALFAGKVGVYIKESQTASGPYGLFYNGVLGKFEDAAFATGTKAFMALLKNVTQAGIPTYVGGGEGREALEAFGNIGDVTHAFTCGGTILKSLTDKHIAFLKAMYLQNMRNE